MENEDLDKLNQIINSNPLLQIVIDDCEDEDEVKDIIKDLIKLKIGEEGYANFGDEIKVEDYFSINDTLFRFNDGLKNEYKLISSGFLSPRNDDEDTVYLKFYKNDRVIQDGEINIYYGFINFNDDGNVGDGAEEEISISIDGLLTKLVEVKEDIITDLDTKINKFQNMIDILN